MNILTVFITTRGTLHVIPASEVLEWALHSLELIYQSSAGYTLTLTTMLPYIQWYKDKSGQKSPVCATRGGLSISYYTPKRYVAGL